MSMREMARTKGALPISAPTTYSGAKVSDAAILILLVSLIVLSLSSRRQRGTNRAFSDAFAIPHGLLARALERFKPRKSLAPIAPSVSFPLFLPRPS